MATRLGAVLLAACPADIFVIAEPAVQLSRRTEFDPDLTVARSGDVGGTKLTAPPLLAVEIRSLSTALIDLTRMKAAYAAFGVASYWIVVPDLRQPEISVFELLGGRYEQTGQATAGETLHAARPFPVEVVPARLVAGLTVR